jgi:hypothetical protein
MLVDTGRFRELSSWRKDFKRAWHKCEQTPITMPLNEKYRPDAHRWVCTCPCFATSRFLICKHLVQAVQSVPLVFFLEAKRNRTTPFWVHHSLIPTISDANSLVTAVATLTLEDRAGADQGDDQEDEDNLVDTHTHMTIGATTRERWDEEIGVIEDFLGGLKYQREFSDPRMLDSLQRKGAGFLHLARSCLDRERRINSSRVSSPTTWESSTSCAMYYRSRPRNVDQGT